MPLAIERPVKHCDRCGQEHMRVVFMKFKEHPVPGYSHFGTCPILWEPILITLPPNAK